MIEVPNFKNPLIDLANRNRDGLLTSYWQRWLKGLYEGLVRPLTVATLISSQSIGQGGSIVLVDATLGPIVLGLPTAKAGYGIPLSVKKIDSSVNAVTITPAAGELIDGAATLVITAQYDSKSFTSDGSAWWVIK